MAEKLGDDDGVPVGDVVSLLLVDWEAVSEALGVADRLGELDWLGV